MSFTVRATLERFTRQAHPELQTLGTITLYDEWNCAIAFAKTLELPDKGNKQDVSRIPAGEYDVIIRKSRKYGYHFHITGVDGRKWILIHAGNYFTQIRGCVLVGRAFADINGDGVMDVTKSGDTLKMLLANAPKGFKLTITE